MEIPLYQIDAFTDATFAGNPAAVCPLEGWLDDERMQAIAAENNLSETAFFVPRDDGDFDLRWFTPIAEVELCGHATLATGHLILTRLQPDRESVGFHTLSGRLDVTRDGGRLAMDLPAIPAQPVAAPEGIGHALGCEADEVLATDNKYLAVFGDERAVLGLAPDMAAILERVRHRQNQKGDSQGSQKVIQAMSWVKGGQPWMTRPYSEDLRERVVRVVESGTSRNAAAKQFDVSISFVVKLMQRWKQRGTIKADKYGGWKKSKLAPHGDRIRALVMENCDITIDELCVLLAAEGIEAKRSTLGDFLLAQGLSRKKRQPTPPSRSALTSRRREPLGATSNLG